DALFPRSQLLILAANQNQLTTADVQLQREGRRLEIHNRSVYPLLLDDLRMAGKVRELGMMIKEGDSFAIYLDHPSTEPCELHCQIVQHLDIILPRRTTLLRYRTETAEILPIFDVGILLQSSAAEQAREEELRWELRQHPHNALAAASLGRLLYRQGRWREAEQYMQQALHAPKALPDGGQRVRLELSQLRRRQGEPTGTAI
ncbi:MAG: hypothetical protein GXP38_16130, partial [Chloroflexi bacterium]|nr:hypothetical protein [Chloroflexota bacterium]